MSNLCTREFNKYEVIVVHHRHIKEFYVELSKQMSDEILNMCMKFLLIRKRGKEYWLYFNNKRGLEVVPDDEGIIRFTNQRFVEYMHYKFEMTGSTSIIEVSDAEWTNKEQAIIYKLNLGEIYAL